MIAESASRVQKGASSSCVTFISSRESIVTRLDRTGQVMGVYLRSAARHGHTYIDVVLTLFN